MSVFCWPPNVLPQKVTWRYFSPSRSAISPLDGDLTIISRPGDRWTAECSFSPIFDDAAADAEAFFARIRHQAHQFVLPPYFYKRRGSFAPVNLAPNGGTFDVIGPWTGSGAAVTIETGMVRVQNSGAAAGQLRSGAVAGVASTSYMIRVECLRGLATAFKVLVGTAAGGSTLLDSGSIGEGVYTNWFTTSGTGTFHVTLVCNSTTTADFALFDNLIVEQCGLTEGTQSGDLLNINNMPSNTAELLKKSDMVECNGQLFKLLNAATSVSVHAQVRVSPVIRGSIPDVTPVIIGTPMGRFVMKDDPAQWDTVGYFEKSFTIAIVEDITT